MEYNNKNWPYLWFGFWSEFGENYKKYPSIKKFINKEVNVKYETFRLIDYLNNGIIEATTSAYSFPSPFTGDRGYGSVSMRTDGKWLWLDNISDYIQNYNLTIPEKWYQEILNNNFKIPDVTQEQILLQREVWAFGL